MSFYKVVKTLEKVDFGNKFSVEKLMVEIPDGRQTEFFMRSGQDYAVVIALDGEQNMIMVEQPRLGLDMPSLEFPMGQVDGVKGEGIAVKELKEETGYTAGKMTLLGELLPSPGWSTQKALIYVATDLTEGEAEPETYEFITVKKISISELKKIISEGKMPSMPTIAAFYLFLDKYAEKLR